MVEPEIINTLLDSYRSLSEQIAALQAALRECGKSLIVCQGADCPRPTNQRCSDTDPNLCAGGGATPSGIGAPCDCLDCHPDIRASLDYGKDGKPRMLTVRTETDTPSFFCCDHPNQENIWEDLCAAINTPPIKWRGFDVMNAIAVRHGLDKLKAEERVTAVEAENKELRSQLEKIDDLATLKIGGPSSVGALNSIGTIATRALAALAPPPALKDGKDYVPKESGE